VIRLVIISNTNHPSSDDEILCFPPPNNNTNGRKLPWRSHLPEAIPLFQTKNPAIYRRHQCLAKIQEHQLSTMKSYLGQQDRSSPPSNSHVLLVDPAYHCNVGDLMITMGERKILERLGYNINSNSSCALDQSLSISYSECHYMQSSELVPYCEDILYHHQKGPITQTIKTQQRKFALWHGGGNWGDLWPSVQKVRIEQSFRSLLRNNYIILGMPQSLYYQHQETEAFDARLLKREIRIGKELGANTDAIVALSWREYESYQRAKQLYPFLDNILLPDVAFQLGPYQRETVGDLEQVDFLFLLRRDQESVLLPPLVKNEETDDDDQSNILDITTISKLISDTVHAAMDTNAPEKSFHVVDWPDRLRLFQSDDPYFTKTAIQLLSLGRVVICDRLHAVILAFLAGMPFIYIDPLTGKITKSLKVALTAAGEGCLGGQHTNGADTMEFLWYAQAHNLTEAIVKGGHMLRLSSRWNGV